LPGNDSVFDLVIKGLGHHLFLKELVLSTITAARDDVSGMTGPIPGIAWSCSAVAEFMSISAAFTLLAAGAFVASGLAALGFADAPCATASAATTSARKRIFIAQYYAGQRREVPLSSGMWCLRKSECEIDAIGAEVVNIKSPDIRLIAGIDSKCRAASPYPSWSLVDIN
jgi:hypothetical protein